MRELLVYLRSELLDRQSELRKAFIASIKTALDESRDCPEAIDNETLAEKILQRIVGE